MAKTGLLGGGSAQGGQTPPFFGRGGGGILPERGSQAQYDMVQSLLQSGLASAGSSGSPLLAFLAPMVGGAVGARTGGLYKDAQQKRDQEAIDALLGAMTPSSAPVLPGSRNPNYGAMAANGGPTRAAAAAAAATPGTPANWEAIRNGIFAGESGGDYNALYGYSNRDGGQFAGTQLTNMTLDEALAFSDPSGPYGQWVKGQVGHVATPMGAYQVVGTTLRAAKDGLGLAGDQRMTPELQDQIGQWIYQTQGTGAWEGYRGAQMPDGTRTPARDAAGRLAAGDFSAMSGFGPQPMGEDGMRALAGLMIDPDVSPQVREMASSMLGDALGSRGGMSPDDQMSLVTAMLGMENALKPPTPPERYRAATPEEAAAYGANAGQIGPDGRFYPAQGGSGNEDAALMRQRNEATSMLNTAVSDLVAAGYSPEEARSMVAQNPLMRAQFQMLGIDPAQFARADVAERAASDAQAAQGGGGFGSWWADLFSGGASPPADAAPAFALPQPPARPAAPAVSAPPALLPENDPLGIR